jgi:hypothetical protein
MKQTIDFTLFKQAFINYNRLNNFPTGLRELFRYLEEIEEETGEQIELDVVALCCDYSEAKLSEVLKDYDLTSLDDLTDRTTVIMVDDEADEDPTIIYQNF